MGVGDGTKMKNLEEFWKLHSDWSQATFGTDAERGPKGPLLHLKKEVEECLQAYEQWNSPDYMDAAHNRDLLRMEIIDCLFLVIDAARRTGMTHNQFLELAYSKLEINKNRRWNKPTSDEPAEHVRTHD
jgi:hypothetical protein